MPRPWNNWFPCIGNTYGTWAYGDPRGFRTWRHRQHVEGDYRNPPPSGTYDQLYEQSRANMPRDAVLLEITERELVGRAMCEKLLVWEIELIELSVGMSHFHMLTRFIPLNQSRGMDIPRLYERGMPKLPPQSALQGGRDPLPRHVGGLLKKHAAHLHRQRSAHPRPGGLWAKRCQVIPVHHRAHQVAVAKYIRDHVDEGAWVYTLHGGD